MPTRRPTTGIRFDEGIRERIEVQAKSIGVKGAVITRWAMEYYLKACEGKGRVILPHELDSAPPGRRKRE